VGRHLPLTHVFRVGTPQSPMRGGCLVFKRLRDQSLPLLGSSTGDRRPSLTGFSAETTLGIGIGMIPVIHEESEEVSEPSSTIDATFSISGFDTSGTFGHCFRSPRSWAFTQGELRAGENNLQRLQVWPCSYACPRRVYLPRLPPDRHSGRESSATLRRPSVTSIPMGIYPRRT
jgi:hypothetical protein